MTDPKQILSFLNPHELKKADENPRAITPERYEALRHAMRKSPDMMLPRPVIVDARKGDIVAGNHRLDVIIAEWDDKNSALTKFIEEWGGVPTYIKEFSSDAERREWMIRDNQGYADWVAPELAALVKMHEDEGADMSLLGLAPDNMKDLLALANDDGPPDEPDAPVDDIDDRWGVVIECDGEQQQAELLEEFTERGLNVRALIA